MRLSDGYIKAYRKTLKSDMYQVLTASQRDVFWACLLLANHKPKQWEWNGEVYMCKPGEFITSLASLKKNCASDTSIKNIRTALDKLEKWDFLAIKATKSGRLISIKNWDIYQMQENETGKDTGKEPAKNRQLTRMIKNVKNKPLCAYTPDFERFWDAYPRKVDKKKAFAAWLKCNGNRPPVDDLILAVQQQAETPSWTDKDGQFIPHPTTWINGERWTDQVIIECQPEQPAFDPPPYWKEFN